MLTTDRTDRRRLVYVLTSAKSVRFLRGQASHMRRAGFDVTLVVSPGREAERFSADEGIELVTIPMTRRISPWRDLKALLRLYWTLRRLRPHVVNAGTPKAGLLGMIAALLNGVPLRVYTLRGLRLETCSGWRRRLLWITEKIAAAAAHRVVCVSPSLRRAFLRQRLASPGKTVVLGRGSSNGVDLNRYRLDSAGEARAAELRHRLRIPAGVPVAGFVGRLTRDKGIVELMEAFDEIRQELPEVRLLLVGDFESEDAVPERTARAIRRDPRVVVTGFVADASACYGAMDVLVLPSHREGFPNVALEAGAAGLPVVAFDATGTRDAVGHGQTGSLVARGDRRALAREIVGYLRDPERRRRHGQAARRRVSRYFRQEVVWRQWSEFYRRSLGHVAPWPEADDDRPARRAA